MLAGVKIINVESEIPHDAKLLRTFFSPERETFVFVYEHESFDEVPEGAIPPEASTAISIMNLDEGMRKAYNNVSRRKIH